MQRVYFYSSGFHRCFSGTVALNLVIESKGKWLGINYQAV
jgi:hypothetical protein